MKSSGPTCDSSFLSFLIYSYYTTSWLDHLRAVFQLLQEHQLVLKHAKCTFGAPKVAYLDHVISEGSVAMDPDKVQAVVDWPMPKSIRHAGLSWSCRLLQQINPQLWLHCSTPYLAPQKGRVPLDRRGRSCIPDTQGSTYSGTGATHA